MEQFTTETRLGDVIDDFCIKCRRLTNHSIVSIVEGKAAKVRCRTCYNDHDYRFEQAPPTKKELQKRAELEALGLDPDAPVETVEADGTVETPAAPPPAKKGRGRTKKA